MAATCCSVVADPDEPDRKSSFLNLILVKSFSLISLIDRIQLRYIERNVAETQATVT